MLPSNHANAPWFQLMLGSLMLGLLVVGLQALLFDSCTNNGAIMSWITHATTGTSGAHLISSAPASSQQNTLRPSPDLQRRRQGNLTVLRGGDALSGKMHVCVLTMRKKQRGSPCHCSAPACDKQWATAHP